MQGNLVQENRCAVCGRPLTLRDDPNRRDEALTMEGSTAGQLPICPDCQDELYYQPAP